MAVMRTINPEAGLVILHVAPGCETEVAAIIDDLKKHVRIETVTRLEGSTTRTL